MKLLDIEEMKGGWFVGDFDPSAYKTKDFEVGYKFHRKGEPWEKHYHEKCTEINLLIKGVMKMRGHVVVVKTNSEKGDKICVKCF